MHSRVISTPPRACLRRPCMRELRASATPDVMSIVMTIQHGVMVGPRRAAAVDARRPQQLSDVSDVGANSGNFLQPRADGRRIIRAIRKKLYRNRLWLTSQMQLQRIPPTISTASEISMPGM